jgi:hypothetical protein
MPSNSLCSPIPGVTPLICTSVNDALIPASAEDEFKNSAHSDDHAMPPRRGLLNPVETVANEEHDTIKTSTQATQTSEQRKAGEHVEVETTCLAIAVMAAGILCSKYLLRHCLACSLCSTTRLARTVYTCANLAG